MLFCEQVYDGASVNVPELGVFCGMNPPSAFFTSGNQMRILFHTDSSGGGQGFLLNWMAVAADSVAVGTVSTPVTQTPVTGTLCCAYYGLRVITK